MAANPTAATHPRRECTVTTMSHGGTWPHSVWHWQIFKFGCFLSIPIVMMTYFRIPENVGHYVNRVTLTPRQTTAENKLMKCVRRAQ